MASTFAFTLYEIFGYLLPGSVALAGLAVLWWSAFAPSASLTLAGIRIGAAQCVVLIVVCYVVGHAVQAIANVVFSQVEQTAVRKSTGGLLATAAVELAAELTGVAPKNIEPRWVFRILDEYSVQVGMVGDREIFIYREGFYRGTSIALFLLALSLFVRTFIRGITIVLPSGPISHAHVEILIGAALCCGLGVLFLMRYKRFAEYRITRAVVAALIQRAGKDTRSASVH